VAALNPFWKRHAAQAPATIVAVQMLERPQYGIGRFSVTYAVQPPDAAGFEATIETGDVNLEHVPQAGQQVAVRYEPGDAGRLEVVTPPGEETGTVTTPTELIPWDESRPVPKRRRPDGSLR
jgi:hypothetical protein